MTLIDNVLLSKYNESTYQTLVISEFKLHFQIVYFSSSNKMTYAAYWIFLFNCFLVVQFGTSVKDKSVLNDKTDFPIDTVNKHF